MRIRDDKKREALFNATIKVVNEIGFAASSVSKIAKEAGVSPATLYIYFQNKEDLLLSTYLAVKESMGKTMLKGYDDTSTVRDSLYLIWVNSFSYATENINEFRYAEQFSNSPFSDRVDKSKIEEAFKPISEIFKKGIELKILKDVDRDVIVAFLFHPILALANPNHCQSFEPTEENIATVFSMAWDALRL